MSLYRTHQLATQVFHRREQESVDEAVPRMLLARSAAKAKAARARRDEDSLQGERTPIREPSLWGRAQEDVTVQF